MIPYADKLTRFLNRLAPDSMQSQSDNTLTREHVIWAYRLFLDREPESERVVQDKVNACGTTQELREIFLISREFQERNSIAEIKVDNPLDLPLPPGELIKLVAGDPNSSWYLLGGQLAARSTRDILEKNGLSIDDFDGILDFGCGCGRVIRQWTEAKAGALYGTDYNPQLIEWCQENLTLAQFSVNGLAPPLNYQTEFFDFVYAFSVFTHLTEELNYAWIEEMSRIVKRGGYLLMTTHGESYLYGLSSSRKRKFQDGELVVIKPGQAGANDCAAYHPYTFVTEKLAPAGQFEVIDFVPKGARGNPHQDVYLLQK